MRKPIISNLVYYNEHLDQLVVWETRCKKVLILIIYNVGNSISTFLICSLANLSIIQYPCLQFSQTWRHCFDDIHRTIIRFVRTPRSFLFRPTRQLASIVLVFSIAVPILIFMIAFYTSFYLNPPNRNVFTIFVLINFESFTTFFKRFSTLWTVKK